MNSLSTMHQDTRAEQAYSQAIAMVTDGYLMELKKKVKYLLICLLVVTLLMIFSGIFDSTFIIYDDPYLLIRW